VGAAAGVVVADTATAMIGVLPGKLSL